MVNAHFVVAAAGPEPAPGNGLLVHDELVGVDGLQEPPEGLAPEPVLDGVPLTQVAHVLPLEVRPVHVEEPLEVVHPDLGHPGGVEAVTVLGNVIRMEWSEDVTNMTTRMVLHTASTAPNPWEESNKYR